MLLCVVWRLVLRGGELVKVEEPALLVPPGHVAVKVRAFLVDDYSLWVFKRGEGGMSSSNKNYYLFLVTKILYLFYCF